MLVLCWLTKYMFFQWASRWNSVWPKIFQTNSCCSWQKKQWTYIKNVCWQSKLQQNPNPIWYVCVYIYIISYRIVSYHIISYHITIEYAWYSHNPYQSLLNPHQIIRYSVAAITWPSGHPVLQSVGREVRPGNVAVLTLLGLGSKMVDRNVEIWSFLGLGSLQRVWG